MLVTVNDRTVTPLPATRFADVARRLGLGLLLLCQLWLLATPPAIAQTPAGSPPAELPPEQVRSLLQLLSE